MIRGGFMKNIAHRGFSGKYPENTKIAFARAIELGADMIELDVTLSKDKIPVVIHDDTLERTSNGKGKVRNVPLDKLKQFDFGSWMNPKFSEERIPTLEEVLQMIKKSKLGLNIEIKSSAFEKKFSDSCIESQTLGLINKYKLFNRIVISSFEPKILLRLRELSSKVKLAYLIEPDYKKLKLDPIYFVNQVKAVSLNMHKSQIKSEIFHRAKERNIPVCVYTVNTTGELRRMNKLELAGVFTNYPDRLKKMTERK
jgi:glycerophosphoryl diester phosphodiesterase